MTSSKFKEAQRELGLTNEEMSTVLMVSLRTVERWRQGSRAIPGPVVVIFRLLVKYRGATKFLLGKLGK